MESPCLVLYFYLKRTMLTARRCHVFYQQLSVRAAGGWKGCSRETQLSRRWMGLVTRNWGEQVHNNGGGRGSSDLGPLLHAERKRFYREASVCYSVEEGTRTPSPLHTSTPPPHRGVRGLAGPAQVTHTATSPGGPPHATTGPRPRSRVELCRHLHPAGTHAPRTPHSHRAVEQAVFTCSCPPLRPHSAVLYSTTLSRGQRSRLWSS